jgi:23S rRNA (guanosine2251-2'-O)-methyltransferase
VPPESDQRRPPGSYGGKVAGKSNKASGRRRPHEAVGVDAGNDPYVYGLHAAEFALLNPNRVVRTIWATENAERKLADAITARNLTVTRCTPRELDKRVGADSVHQGIVLEVAPPELVELAELLETAVASGQPIVLLDQVTDPHNVGAILRSCAVFGAAGLIMTQRHSPRLGGTLAKSASGALDLLPICLVQNLAKAITEIKAQRLAVIGLDGAAENPLLEVAVARRHDRPLVFALGAEGKGLRELTRQLCDDLCKIASDGPIASLNVSNAAAISLHVAAMQRRAGGR